MTPGAISPPGTGLKRLEDLTTHEVAVLLTNAEFSEFVSSFSSSSVNGATLHIIIEESDFTDVCPNIMASRVRMRALLLKVNHWRAHGVPHELLVQTASDLSIAVVARPPDASTWVFHHQDKITDRTGIFCSLRFNNPVLMAQAEEIQTLLSAHDIEATIIKVLSGGNILAKIVDSLSTCRMALIFGTEDYGEEGTVKFSTRGELEFIQDNNIPFFLLKMCDNFRDPTTSACQRRSVIVPFKSARR